MKNSFKKLPHTLYPFFWSDYAELQTMASADGVFSKKDFTALVTGQQEGAACSKHLSLEDVAVLWQRLIQLCVFRSQTYKRQYPFQVADDKESLSCTFIKTQPQQRLYLGVLLAANRGFLPVSYHDELTRDYAQLCHQLFIQLMPSGVEIQRLPAVVNQFPQPEQVAYIAKTSRGQVLLKAADYAQDRIELPSQQKQPEVVKSGIVDLLAWHPMGDTRDAIPVAIARCDCESENWLNGQQALLNLETHFYTRHACAKYHFSPIDLYNENKDWALKERLGRVILIDRYRILSLAEEYFIYNDVPDWELIDRVCQCMKEE